MLRNECSRCRIKTLLNYNLTGKTVQRATAHCGVNCSVVLKGKKNVMLLCLHGSMKSFDFQFSAVPQINFIV